MLVQTDESRHVFALSVSPRSTPICKIRASATALHSVTPPRTHTHHTCNNIESHERWWHHELSGLCSSGGGARQWRDTDAVTERGRHTDRRTHRQTHTQTLSHRDLDTDCKSPACQMSHCRPLRAHTHRHLHGQWGADDAIDADDAIALAPFDWTTLQ